MEIAKVTASRYRYCSVRKLWNIINWIDIIDRFVTLIFQINEIENFEELERCAHIYFCLNSLIYYLIKWILYSELMTQLNLSIETLGLILPRCHFHLTTFPRRSSGTNCSLPLVFTPSDSEACFSKHGTHTKTWFPIFHVTARQIQEG